MWDEVVHTNKAYLVFVALSDSTLKQGRRLGSS